jgi:hypothetical protein
MGDGAYGEFVKANMQSSIASSANNAISNCCSGEKRMNDQVTLTRDQADICRTVLCQALMKTCQLIGTDQNADGDPLDDDSRHDLVALQHESAANSDRSRNDSRRTGAYRESLQ